MENSKLTQLIKESITNYLSEIEEAGNIEATEAKLRKIEEAIVKRTKQINMEGLDEVMQELVDKGKIKELQTEVKALEKKKTYYQKQLDKFKSKAGKGKKSEESESEENTKIVDETAAVTSEVNAEVNAEEVSDDIYEINEQTLYMQKIAGIISEAKYVADLEKLNNK